MAKKVFIGIIFLLNLLDHIRCQNFRVDGRYIYNGDKAFTALGVNYSPIPIGASQAYDATDRGDCYGNDWNFLHRRDIPMMRNIGINSIRTYNWFPWRFPSPENPQFVEKLRNDHTNILDMLWNDGVDPIYIWISYHIPIVFHYKISSNKPTDRVSWRLRTGEWAFEDPEWDEADTLEREIVLNALKVSAQNYGDHPAVIGFVIGNEKNDEYSRYNPLYWKFINDVGEAVKEIAPNKLTMVGIVDDGHLTVQAAESLGLVNNIDVWGINSYRGNVEQGFDILFVEYAKLTNKPLLITEYGTPSSTRDDGGNVIIMPDNAKPQADYIKVHFEDIIAHRNICSGGYIFEYSDEWWKNTDPNNQDPNVAPNPAYPGGQGDEEYFGIFGIKLTQDGKPEDYKTRIVDTLDARAAVQTLTEMFKPFDFDDVPEQEDLIIMPPTMPFGPEEPLASPVSIVPIQTPQVKPPEIKQPEISPSEPEQQTPIDQQPQVNEPLGEQDNPPVIKSTGWSAQPDRKSVV